MIATTSINAASTNSMDSYIQDKTSSNEYISKQTRNWTTVKSTSSLYYDKNFYTLKSLSTSHLKNPKHLDAFMDIVEYHMEATLVKNPLEEYPTPNQIADLGNKVLAILNNLDSFTVENKVDVYNYDSYYGTKKKSNTKNYKNNTALINAFLEGKVLPQKNLGDTPFKAKMFTH